MFLLAKNQLPKWNEVYIRFLSPNNVTHLISVKKSIKAFIYSRFFVKKLWLMSPTNLTKKIARKAMWNFEHSLKSALTEDAK